MKTQTKETQTSLTASEAVNILVEGNKRFVQNIKASRNLKQQVSETSGGQFPFAAILSCIDSRVPAELVFDQGIGDIFSVRVAGNVVNEDVLGSIEYSCKVAGSKVVMVLGHTSCGAVTAACKQVELGNITALLSKIQPAVREAKITDNANVSSEVVDDVAIKNIHHSINEIRKDSPILKEMEDNGEIEIVGAIYSVSTGEVKFV